MRSDMPHLPAGPPSCAAGSNIAEFPGVRNKGDRAPWFIRAYVQRPCLCYLFWLVIPITLAYMVSAHITLTDPLEGWRIRDHPTAETLDAIILATRQCGLHDDDKTGPPPPPLPPMAPPMMDVQPSAAAAPQSQDLGRLVLLFEASEDGGSVLTRAHLAEIDRIERAVLARVSAICLLVNSTDDNSTDASRSCAAVVSVSAHMPTDAAVSACVVNRSSTLGAAFDAGRLEEACVAETLGYNVGHSDRVPTSAYEAGLDSSYWSLGGAGDGGGVALSEGERTQLILSRLAAPLAAGGEQAQQIRRALTELVDAALETDPQRQMTMGEAMLRDAQTQAALLQLLLATGGRNDLGGLDPSLLDPSLLDPSFWNASLLDPSLLSNANETLGRLSNASLAGLSGSAAQASLADMLQRLGGSGGLGGSGVLSTGTLSTGALATLTALSAAAAGALSGSNLLPGSSSLSGAATASSGSASADLASLTGYSAAQIAQLLSGGASRFNASMSPDELRQLISFSSSAGGFDPSLLDPSLLANATLSGLANETLGRLSNASLVSVPNATEVQAALVAAAEEHADLLRLVNDTQRLANLIVATGAIASSISPAGTPDDGSSISLVNVTDEQVAAIAAEARAGTLRGYEPSAITEISTWSVTDARFAATLLRTVAAVPTSVLLAATSAPPPPPPPLADERLHALLSRDYDRARASAVRSYFALGYPLAAAATAPAGGASAATTPGASDADAQRELVYAYLWPMLDTLLREESARGGLVTVAWDVQGGAFSGFATWLGNQVIWSDLSLAGLSLLFIYFFICLHSRSVLLGTLGTLEIFCSFPLALFVYRLVLGVRLFGVMHIIGIYVILGIGGWPRTHTEPFHDHSTSSDRASFSLTVPDRCPPPSHPFSRLLTPSRRL